MPYYLSKMIVLVGLMGAGKTTIGRLLAQKLGCNFIDSDIEIQKAAACTIVDIFEQYGEDFFRKRESEVLRRLLTTAPGVLSIGGGAYISAENRKMISQSAVSIWLKADFNVLWQRVKGKSTRPLLHHKNPQTILHDLIEKRRPYYASADLTVVSQRNCSKERMANRVLHSLLSYPKNKIKKYDKISNC